MQTMPFPEQAVVRHGRAPGAFLQVPLPTEDEVPIPEENPRREDPIAPEPVEDPTPPAAPPLR